MKLKRKIELSSFQIILLSFAGVILIGALLLMLPVSNREGAWTPFVDSLFTSVSAVCVTGLIVFDTAAHWSIFGQIVILLLIQIGGMGVVTVAVSFAFLSGRKIGLFGRDTIKESLSAPNTGGIVRLTKFILKGIFLIELVGALVMLPVFCIDYGAYGIWLAIFHSISAFCNAGFDIIGSPTGSLTPYAAHPLINIIIMLLIIIGGIGFLVWEDVCVHKWRLSKYRLQSKVVLLVSGVLILLPALWFFFFEFETLPIGERIFLSLFQSVTTRTAGFNTADLTAISEPSRGLMTALMLIGGSPGSTAGGMKTMTIAVLFAVALSVFRNKSEVSMLKRRIDDGAVKHAVAIFLRYLSLFLVGGFLISVAENLPLSDCLFEAASAMGTVGLSLGITPTLGIFSKIVLMVLMFIGRVGGLTLIYATLGNRKNQVSKLPLEKITVG
ncbi:MAG: Trk family potassium uptake protein [Clostridia bacterium]|nr:Trk family potassium uptake protein [Clostridia bacterium]